MHEKKTFQIQAEGNSMWPILQDGDRVEYVQTPFAQIQLNDIVLEYTNNIFVTHRVIYKTKGICITRGDNNPQADRVIKKGRVIAKVVRFKRKGMWHGIHDVYMSQSMMYLHEIQKVTLAFTTFDISHVFLKGVLVSLRYEGAIPKRIYADCDVLVKRDDQIKIENVFNTLGYKLQGRALTQLQHLPAGRQDCMKGLQNKPEVSFMKIVSGVPVVFDVHYEPVFLMTQLGGMNMLYPSHLLVKLGNTIIQNRELKKIHGFNYPICSNLDQILYLALHIFHHNFTDSMRYQLLDSVVRKQQCNWKVLANIINEYKLGGYVYGVFILIKKYFHTPIPPSFLISIRPSRSKLFVLRSILPCIDIFSQDTRTKAGLVRFSLILLLSPNPWWKKLLLFIHPQTIDIFFTVIKSSIRRLISLKIYKSDIF